MRATPLIRPARPEDVTAMLPHLRAKDALDVLTATRGSVEAAMRRSFEESEAAWVWEVDGAPACFWGVTVRSVVAGGALVWIFTGNQVERHRRTFWMGSKVVLEVLLARYGAVEGFCDARFLQSMQWLRRLGFSLGEPLTVAGVSFHHFEMVKA